ncbi:MAG TPA: 4'-phosphopantetheinyl transferase superfamily protein [Syntrophales bacterium]|nr:4'-phosphopantetheinyl transferase superfamily protein [Syntrophales bacterium]
MPYVGNDIVDLLEPGNRGKSRDARFLKRVFTADECLKVLLSREGDLALWTLWAAKETAFKVMQKHDPHVSSRPRHYPVLLFPPPPNASEKRDGLPLSGVVTTPRGSVHVRLLRTSRYVHCIGTDAPWPAMDAIQWRVNERPAGSDESRQVREEAKRHMARHFREAPEAICIRQAAGTGAPLVYLGDRRTSIDLSMSHDGRFTAHAFWGKNPFAADEGRAPGRMPETSTRHDFAGCRAELASGDRVRTSGFQSLP